MEDVSGVEMLVEVAAINNFLELDVTWSIKHARW
jgi:hypothetical protein